MKKTLLLLSTLSIFASCSSEDIVPEDPIIGRQYEATFPEPSIPEHNYSVRYIFTSDSTLDRKTIRLLSSGSSWDEETEHGRYEPQKDDSSIYGYEFPAGNGWVSASAFTLDSDTMRKILGSSPSGERVYELYGRVRLN